MSRTNPQTNPVAPMVSTGVPVRKMGSVTMVDWAALSSPVNRTNFGMAPQQDVEPTPPPSAGGGLSGAVDRTFRNFFGAILGEDFANDAADTLIEFENNVENAITSWVQDYLDRQRDIQESRRDARESFGPAIVTAVGDATKGLFSGLLTGFGKLADELNIPRPQRKTLQSAYDNVVKPVVEQAQPLVGRIFGSTIPDPEFVGDFVKEVSSQRLGVIMAAPPQQVAARQARLEREMQKQTEDLQQKFRAAGIEESLDESAQLYYAFTGRMANFAQREAQALPQPQFKFGPDGKLISRPAPGTPNVFNSVPLGLEPFAVENPDKTFSLVGRFYSAQQEAAIELATSGRYTREEVTERLQSDPGLLQGAKRVRGGQDGRYLTPEKILDDEGVFRTIGGMSINQLADLKMNLVKRGYMDEEDVGSLTTRDINQATLTGFANMVRSAQENGYTWEGWRDQINENSMFFGRPAPQRQAPLIRVTSPTDIKAVANRVAQQTIGYQLEEGELEQFVATYQQMERQSQMRAAGGGTVEMPADIGTAAQEMITGGARQAEADAFAVGNTIDILRQIISGGGR
jgi:hypothetical protein